MSCRVCLVEGMVLLSAVISFVVGVEVALTRPLDFSKPQTNTQEMSEPEP
jgi:hypothetical protein